jgi:drug/metabolite transporter (DMT)-like permease
VAARSSITALAVLALLLVSRAPLNLPAATLRRAPVIGMVLAVQSYCLYSSVARIPVALALLAFNTFPMILVLMTWIVDGERPPRGALAAMPVALAGLALALDAFGSGGNIAGRWTEIGAGVGFALVASVSFATVMFLTARWLKDVDGRLRSCLNMGTVGVVTLAGGALTGSLSPPADAMGWLGISLLTLFYGSAITALFVVMPRMRAASDIAVLNFEPIAVLFLAWTILGQSVAPLQIVGAVIVIGAIVALGTARH